MLIDPYRYAVSATDPFFGSVVLLMHFDGTNGSTSFVDQKGNTVTPFGNAQIDTSDKLFGTGAGLFDGTGDYLTTTGFSLALGSSDFCIEVAAKPITIVGQDTLMTNRDSAGAGSTQNWLFYINNGVPGWLAWDNGTGSIVVNMTGGSALSTSTFTRLATTRNGSTFRLFNEGTQVATATYAPLLGYSGYPLYIGRDPTTTTRDFHGRLEELRITIGNARYTSNYTPATAAFPNS